MTLRQASSRTARRRLGKAALPLLAWAFFQPQQAHAELCGPGSNYRPVAPGIFYYDCSDKDPAVHVVTIDRSLPDVELRILAKYSRDDTKPGELQLYEVDSLAKEAGALAAINGMYWTGDQGFLCADGWCEGTPDTTVIINGNQLTGLLPKYPTEQLMGFTSDGSSGIRAKRIGKESFGLPENLKYRSHMYGSVNPLLNGGEAQPETADRDNQSVLGYSKDHIVMLTTVAKGGVPGGFGWRATELIDTLRQFGVTDAVRNDGGPSVGLYVGGAVSKFEDPVDKIEERKVGDTVITVTGPLPRKVAYAIGVVRRPSTKRCNDITDGAGLPLGQLCITATSLGYDAELSVTGDGTARCGQFSFNLLSRSKVRYEDQGAFEVCTGTAQKRTYFFETGPQGGCATLHLYPRGPDVYGRSEWSVPACTTDTLSDEGGGGTGTIEPVNKPPTVTLESPRAWQLFTASGEVALDAAISDDAGDSHTCVVDWDDGRREHAPARGGRCALTHRYAAAGMYTIGLTVRDAAGAEAAAKVLVVVHDPKGGWANLDGSLASPAGALRSAPEHQGELWTHLTGRYYNGEPTVVGVSRAWIPQTAFRLEPEKLDWMVVTPDGKTAAKGTGTIAGQAGYGFLLYGYEGCDTATAPRCQPGADRARLVVWPLSSGAYPSGTLTYDSASGAELDVDRVTLSPLQSGSVLLQWP